MNPEYHNRDYNSQRLGSAANRKTSPNENDAPPELFIPSPFKQHREAVIDKIVTFNCARTGQSGEIREWATDDLRALRAFARENPDYTAGMCTLFSFEYKSENYSSAEKFYDYILTNPAHPTIIQDALKSYPASDEAMIIAKGLLRRSPADREIGLSIITSLCQNRMDPSINSIVMWTGGVLKWLLENMPTQELPPVVEKLPLLFQSASPEFLRMIEQVAHENALSPHSEEQKSWEIVIEALSKTRTPETFTILTGVGISHKLPLEKRRRCLEGALRHPPEGLPALLRFIKDLQTEEDPDRQKRLEKLLSTIDDAARGYWGNLTPWVYEGPLRKLYANGIDPLRVIDEICPAVREGTFLFAYNLTDGELEHLRAINTVYKTVAQSDGDIWLRAELKKSLVRASFLPPTEQFNFLWHFLPQLELTELHGCFDFIDVLGLTLTKQCRYYPQLAVHRLVCSAGSEVSIPPAMCDWLESAYPDVQQRDAARSFIEISPHEPLVDQALATSRKNLAEWLGDDAWYAASLGRDGSNTIEPFSPRRLGVNPVAQFVRAHTIHEEDGTKELFSELGRIFDATDPLQRERWEKYRYPEENTLVARQLRSLSPLARRRWMKDSVGMIMPRPERGIGMQSERQPVPYLGLLTDWPEFIFKIGKFPIMTAACTAYDSGAYYSKALISYLVDSHIKAMLLFDLERLFSQVAPQLPQDARERLLAVEINEKDLYQYAGAFMQACVSRTVVKLVEDEYLRPFLLLEPSFTRGSLIKQQPNWPTLEFLTAVAQRLNVGLATAAYKGAQNEPNMPLLLPGHLPARALTIPPSRSPVGQMEGWDGATWVSCHRQALEIIGLEFMGPKQE